MSKNVIANIVGAIVRIVVAVEDIIFDIVIKPILLALYGIVKDTQWVEVIDRIFDLMAESWPPEGKVRHSSKK